MKFELIAQTRMLQGTGASRRLRRAKKVPGIIYGGADAPSLIEMDHNAVFLALKKKGFASSVITVIVDGKPSMALLRDAQLHPYKQQVLHLDFLRVDAAQMIQQKIPLQFINAEQSIGVKVMGGIVSHTMNDVLVTCLPKDLPSSVVIDLKDLAAGKTIHLSEVSFPAGVKAITHGGEDPVVASITAKRVAEEKDAAAPDAAPTPAA